MILGSFAGSFKTHTPDYKEYIDSKFNQMEKQFLQNNFSYYLYFNENFNITTSNQWIKLHYLKNHLKTFTTNTDTISEMNKRHELLQSAMMSPYTNEEIALLIK